MRKYRQLTFEDRIYIEVLHWERRTQKEIAELLGVHRSTICRELKRGRTGTLGIGYMGYIGEKRRRIKAGLRGRKCVITGSLERQIVSCLKNGWSPEQISGRLKYEGRRSVSHEAIYQYVQRDRNSGGKLFLNLRWGHKRRKKRFSVPRVRSDILARKPMSERPEIINKRERLGDWERDLMFGDSKKSALLTIVDRKSRYTIIRKVKSKSPKEVSEQTRQALDQEIKHSLTNDNGFEFRFHERESEDLKIPIYFTAPYASWEKGTNENTNGLIRQYFPKRSLIKGLTDEKIKEIEKRLNTRPRKGLGFQTPLEVHIEGKTQRLFKL